MKINKILISLMVIILLVTILTPVSAINNGSWTSTDYITPTTLDTYKTATVECVLRINYAKGDSGNPTFRFSTAIFDSSSRPMWESGWDFKVYRDLYGSGNKETKELYHHATGQPYYDTAQWECGNFPNNYVYIYMETTVPLSTNEPYFYNHIYILQKDSTDVWRIQDDKFFKITIKGDMPEPNIELDANALSKTIDPDTTTYHQFVVTNLNDVGCYVSFEYEIIFKDEFDNKLDSDCWSIGFQNSGGEKIYGVMVEGDSPEICSMAIHSPKASDAPADATVKIKLTAKAVNDIDRSVTKTIGGDRLITSRDFTGSNAGTSVWESTLIYFGILIIIIIVVIIVLFRITEPKKR